MCIIINFINQGETGDEGAVPLNLKSVEGVFYVTMYGMGLACIFVVIEMFLHNLKVSVREKKSLRKALKEEISFYFKFGENVKPVSGDDESKKSKSGSGQEKEFPENGVEKVGWSPPPMGFVIDGKPLQNGSVKSGKNSKKSNGKSSRST